MLSRCEEGTFQETIDPEPPSPPGLNRPPSRFRPLTVGVRGGGGGGMKVGGSVQLLSDLLLSSGEEAVRERFHGDG